jgi:sugar phosphate isomerase/epimerase
MNHYCVVGESLLNGGQRDQAIELARYLREYGQVAHRLGMSFLLEAAAYDIMQLLEHALDVDDEAADDLLSVMLELDQEIKEESEKASLLGVRRSQVQMG